MFFVLIGFFTFIAGSYLGAARDVKEPGLKLHKVTVIRYLTVND